MHRSCADGWILHHLPELEAGLENCVSTDDALEIIQNPAVVTYSGEELRCVRLSCKCLVHTVTTFRPNGLEIRQHSDSHCCVPGEPSSTGRRTGLRIKLLADFLQKRFPGFSGEKHCGVLYQHFVDFLTSALTFPNV
jgi:hypothetical protein